MILSERLIRGYQEEYKHKFGKDISAKDAEQELLNLKDLVRLIVKTRRQRHGN